MGDGDVPDLSYQVFLVKWPALYSLVKGAMIEDVERHNSQLEGHPEYQETYQPIDPAPWGAREAYVHATGGVPDRPLYLLCYTDRIVTIRFPYQLCAFTESQMAIVGEKLTGFAG